MLTHLLERLYAQQTFEHAVARVLIDAVAMHGAEFGNLQLPADNGVLLLVAQRGFRAPFLQVSLKKSAQQMAVHVAARCEPGSR